MIDRHQGIEDIREKIEEGVVLQEKIEEKIEVSLEKKVRRYLRNV